MSLTLVQATPVPAPTRTPREFGLFSVFSFREGASRWENGVLWTSGTTEPAGGIGQFSGQDIVEPEAVPIGLPKTLDQGPSTLHADPLTVYGHNKCSPVGFSLDENEEFARRHLLEQEEARIEQALWTGDLGNEPNFSGANGFDSPASLGTQTDARVALALLEGWIAKNYPGKGVIHAGRATASYLSMAAGLEIRGGRLFTALGTPVVAGAGYGEDKIVVTGAVTGYRSEIIASSNRAGDLLDRGANDLYSIAERMYLIMVDDAIAEVEFDFTGGEVVSGGTD